MQKKYIKKGTTSKYDESLVLEDARKILREYGSISIGKLTELLQISPTFFSARGLNIRKIFEEEGVKKDNGPLERHTTESIRRTVTTFIQEKGRYVSTEEIEKELVIDHRTLNKYGVSPLEIADELGYIGLQGRGAWPAEFRKRQVEKIKNEHRRLIVGTGAPVSFNKLSQLLGFKGCTTLWKKLKEDDYIVNLHKELGFEYVRGDFIPTSENILEICRAEISKRNRYIGMDEFVEFTGYSEHALRLAIGDIVEFNFQAGASRRFHIFEDRTYEALLKLGFKVIREKTFPDLRSDKDCPLRFDFYLPDHNLLIETDGGHEDVNSPFYKERTIIHDKMKIQYCQEKSINLLVIHIKKYSSMISVEDVRNLVSEYISQSDNSTSEVNCGRR